MDYIEDSKRKSLANNPFESHSNNNNNIFTLKKFEWDKKSIKNTKDNTIGNKGRIIKSIAVSNNTIVIATNSCSILRWNVTDGSKEPDKIDIASKVDDSIEKVFIDYTGHHVVVIMKSSDNYYLHSRSQRPKKLSKLQGTIKCIAFDKVNSTESTTRSFLVGTSLGMIYELALDFAGKEKLSQLVYQIDQPVPVTAIYFDVLSNTKSGSASSSEGGGRLFVMWATSAPTRLYHYTGGPNFQSLFAACAQDHSAPYMELPGEMPNAELHCYSKGGLHQQQSTGRAQNFALMSEMGIYHGSLRFAAGGSTAQSGGENVMLEAQHLPYVEPVIATNNERTVSRASIGGVHEHRPISLAVTEYHFLVLRNDRLQVLSSLNGLLVQEELVGEHNHLGSTEGIALGLAVDAVKKNMWLFTTTSIFQVNASEEDKNVWKVYLDRATAAGDEKLFEAAYSYSKTKEQRQQIMRARASHCTSEGRNDQAAIYYAQAGLSFDEVALRLVNCLDGSKMRPGSKGVGNNAAGSNGNSNTFYSITSPDYLSHIEARSGAAPISNTNSLYGGNMGQKSFSETPSFVDAVLTVGSPLTPLRVFLLHTLKVIPASAKMQRTMLCTWLCDIFLHQIFVAAPNKSSSNRHRRGSGSKRRGSADPTASDDLNKEDLIEEFKEFLRSNKTVMDIPTTLQLIIARNDSTLLHFFAQIVGDYERVVKIHMNQQRYTDVVNVLNQAPLEKIASLIYQTAPVLIEAEPEATVNMLLSKPQLAFSGILPAILRYSSALDKQLAKTGDHDDEVLLDQDFEGNHINFASDYLTRVLRSHHGFLFSSSTGDGSLDTTDFDNDDSGLLLRSSIILDAAPVGGTGLSTTDGPEAALFHTLVWLLCRYDNRDDDESVLVKLLRTLYEIKTEVFIPITALTSAHEADDAAIAAAGQYVAVPMGSGISCDGGLTSCDIDFEFMLRQCQQYNKKKAAIFVLLLIGRYKLAIQEALKLSPDMAKRIASQQVDLELKRQLWLTIAMHTIEETGDVKTVVALIAESDEAINIDDLLPHMPDFTELEHVQVDICKSLEKCGNKIQSLKSKMQELASAAENTVQELESMKNRAYSMASPHQKCEYCIQPLFSVNGASNGSYPGGEVFYLFPCSHGFHAKCLLERAPQHLNTAQLAAVRGIEEAFLSLSGHARVATDRRARVKQEALQQELDGYIAADCPLCGYVMIESLSVPLITEDDQAEAQSWQL